MTDADRFRAVLAQAADQAEPTLPALAQALRQAMAEVPEQAARAAEREAERSRATRFFYPVD